jgi:polyisoprenoid-binding protein YceI
MRILRTATTALALTMMLTAALGSLSFAEGNPCNPCNPDKMKGSKFVISGAKNTASFTSEAPLEQIVGISSELSGYIMFNPCNPKAGGSGKLSIPVSSLKTGIPMRDKHLISADWLDASNHPNITFEVKKLKNLKEVSKKKGSMTYEATVVGDFSLHGKTKSMEVSARFTFLEESGMTKMQAPGGGNLLVGRVSFDVALKDFDVPSKQYRKIIGAKVGESVTVAVSFYGLDKAGEGNPLNPCNPCNPHGGKKAMNPCNPGNPCNPCGK